MKVQTKFKTGAGLVLGMCLILGLSWTSAHGDDLNPPDYRGGPLSVYAHWSGDDTGGLYLEGFSWVDDNDPDTYLYPLDLAEWFPRPETGSYLFEVPNFVDEMPIKYLRLQLTWTGTTLPPLDVHSAGMESGDLVPGIITYVSEPLVFTQPDGGYQYFDIEYRPNPDFEWIHIQLHPDAHLTQVVVDSISIPEPATLGLLVLGGLVMSRRRRVLSNGTFSA